MSNMTTDHETIRLTILEVTWWIPLGILVLAFGIIIGASRGLTVIREEVYCQAWKSTLCKVSTYLYLYYIRNLKSLNYSLCLQ